MFRPTHAKRTASYPILLIIGAIAAMAIALLNAGTATAVGGAQLAETTELAAQVVDSQDLGDGYTQLETILSAQFTRTDGTSGSYAIPLTLVFPQDSSQCSEIAVLDVVNSVFYKTFDFAGTSGDPFFPSLLPLARMIAGDAFFRESGYVYGAVVWDKNVLERRREAGPCRTRRFISSAAQMGTSCCVTRRASCARPPPT